MQDHSSFPDIQSTPILQMAWSELEVESRVTRATPAQLIQSREHHWRRGAASRIAVGDLQRQAQRR